MIERHPGSARAEVVALSIPLLVALAELILRNQYHQIAAEPTRFIYLGFIAAVTLGLAFVTERGRPDGAPRQMLRSANRLLGLGTWAWIVVLRGAAFTAWLRDVAMPVGIATLVCGVVLGWIAAGESRWRRIRPALLLAASLFVLSQPLLSRTMSPAITWPDPQGTPHAADARTGTLVILLDELNAREGPGLAQSLRAHGMTVVERAIDPVADTTAKVIPQIWSGRRFDSPKPCSFTAICSERAALDFAKVTASRDDVDVVGFYHPYCAIRGLRWCVRVGLALPFAEVGRWACSIESRLGLDGRDRCIALQQESFLKLRDEVMQATWRAPFWRQGGMLFAHLPMPHPPGARAGGTLKQDYKDNVQLASRVLDQMVERARAAGLERLRLVVFSDHPLRQPLWCAKQAYQVRGCKPDAELDDRQVPLIVATFGVEAPDLSGIRTNAQVFELVRGAAP